MNFDITYRSFEKDLQLFFEEDDLVRNAFYVQSLPEEMVQCQLKLKSDLLLSGLPWFFGVFKYLGYATDQKLLELEGSQYYKKDECSIDFELPFSVALMGERIALNLLQMSSSISTYTQKFVEKACGHGISILDTRKTLPGHRKIQKYAVRVGGGYNHRFGQNDLWMVKDNHKSYFGGLENAISFFKKMRGFYVPIIAEIHDLEELKEAIALNLKHIMLDNFSAEDITKAVELKKEGMTYEVSGGINLDTIEDYLVSGIDAISIGSLTYGAPPVDISLKYQRSI